jgi:hypothetical protein
VEIRDPELAATSNDNRSKAINLLNEVLASRVIDKIEFVTY